MRTSRCDWRHFVNSEHWLKKSIFLWENVFAFWGGVTTCGISHIQLYSVTLLRLDEPFVVAWRFFPRVSAPVFANFNKNGAEAAVKQRDLNCFKTPYEPKTMGVAFKCFFSPPTTSFHGFWELPSCGCKLVGTRMLLCVCRGKVLYSILYWGFCFSYGTDISFFALYDEGNEL